MTDIYWTDDEKRVLFKEHEAAHNEYVSSQKTKRIAWESLSRLCDRKRMSRRKIKKVRALFVAAGMELTPEVLHLKRVVNSFT